MQRPHPRFIVAGILVLGSLSTMSYAVDVRISCDHEQVEMGRAVCVTAKVSGEATRQILLPYVNQRRWGAHERPDAAGEARFILPLPEIGPARIQVLAVPEASGGWLGLPFSREDLLLTGRPMPADEGVRSNTVEVEVQWRVPCRPDNGDTLVGMQWEPWFVGGARDWGTTYAVPLLGLYSSYDPQIIRQHLIWFMDIGVDFIMPDWSNHLWGKKHWDERGEGVNCLIHATQVTLETMAVLRDEGLPVPKMVLMPGLSNGEPATMEAFNEELDWIYQNWLRNPRFDGLWQEFDGKPLIVSLDTGGMAHPDARTADAFKVPFFKETLELSEEELDRMRAVETATTPVDDTHFTVRWMSSQNQTTGHDKLGYWTWMDGVIDAPVTYRDGVAEAATVSTAIFDHLGWTHPTANTRRGGATYVDSFNVALPHRPKVILLHQFNEFRGQGKGHGRGDGRDIYTDSYSVEGSDDIEPVSLTADGYRDDSGGYGFYYLNLTQALLAIYRSPEPADTVLAVRAPLADAVEDGPTLAVEWTVTGAPPRAYALAIDGETVADGLTVMRAEVDIAGLAPGPHRLKVTATGATTRYPLSSTHLDTVLDSPVPVSVEVPFNIKDRG